MKLGQYLLSHVFMDSSASGCLRHVVIPGINQLPDLMELIFKLSRGRLVGVPDGLVNVLNGHSSSYH